MRRIHVTKTHTEGERVQERKDGGPRSHPAQSHATELSHYDARLAGLILGKSDGRSEQSCTFFQNK